MPEICGSPDTDEWLRLKIGAVVELPSGVQMLVVDDDGGYDSPVVNWQEPKKRLHYTFAELETGKTLRLPRNQVAFDIFCETWKVLTNV